MIVRFVDIGGIVDQHFKIHINLYCHHQSLKGRRGRDGRVA